MFIVKEIEGKGKGLFAKRKIDKGKHIFHSDISKLPSFLLKDLHKHPLFKDYSEHSNYQGDGYYTIDLSPVSYMNHSCAPNCVVKMTSISITDYFALKEIQPEEELTVDYSLAAVDQFAGKDFWELECKCGSLKCRGTITGDFFSLPIEIQRKFYKNLPPSILKKYSERFEKYNEEIKK